MRYRIADAMIDLIHLFWASFVLAPVGTFMMGGASIFAPLKERYPSAAVAATMLALVVLPALSIRYRQPTSYAISRSLSAVYFVYLSWLCLVARPVSTGVIYSAVALGAVLLALSALHTSYEGA